ncbi:hypothetical protein ACMD2_19735, partial [Ananas comosus]
MAGVVEPIILAALGWVASPLVAKLLAEGYLSLGINAEKKLRKVRDTVLPVLKSVIEEAEGSPHRSEVERWLQRLKDAYDGAEDALDLLNYNRLKRKAAAAARRRSSGKRPSNNPVRSSSFFHIPKPVKWVIKGGLDMLSPQKIKLKRRLKKLKKIAGEAEKLSTLLGAQPEAADSRQTISVPPQRVFGRDEDRDEIIRCLEIEPAAGLPIIAITALAQYVCDQLRSELGDRQHFDPIIKIAAAIGAAVEHIVPLEDMEENYFSDLFIHYALPSGEIFSHLREELEEKCKTVAKKLNKDPTAAEMVGKTIATEMARLFRSQGHTFEALQLVQLWMAQGFIKPDDQKKRMED